METLKSNGYAVWGQSFYTLISAGDFINRVIVPYTWQFRIRYIGMEDWIHQDGKDVVNCRL